MDVGLTVMLTGEAVSFEGALHESCGEITGGSGATDAGVSSDFTVTLAGMRDGR